MSGDFAQKSADAIWWNNMAGPSRFVAETAAVLCEGQSVCIYTQGKLSFRDTLPFPCLVAGVLRETDSSLLLENVIDTTETPAMYLIDRLGISSGFRETMQPADYLLRSRKLSNRLFPVIADDETADGWLDFIGSYKSESLEDGLFLLEAVGAMPASIPKNMHLLNYADYVSEYDALLYAGMVMEQSLDNAKLKRYIATMAVSFFGTEAERIADFIRWYHVGQDPFEFIPADLSSERRLWNAQVQELFPLIMQETHEFIEKWLSQFEEAFAYIETSRAFRNSPFPDGLRNMLDERIASPHEMEIAMIDSLMRRRRRNRDGEETFEYVLFIPDEDARNRIRLLHELRNRIAHEEVCPVESVVELLCHNLPETT